MNVIRHADKNFRDGLNSGLHKGSKAEARLKAWWNEGARGMWCAKDRHTTGVEDRNSDQAGAIPRIEGEGRITEEDRLGRLGAGRCRDGEPGGK